MAQKVNPISLRLGKTNRDFDSCWFNHSNYVNLLQRDLQIQFYLDSVLKKLDYSAARYFIVNLPMKTKIHTFSYDLNKNKYKASRILHINCKKKTKKYKKNLSRVNDNRISLYTNKIFNYLTRNFYTNSSLQTYQLSDVSIHDTSNLIELKQNFSRIRVNLLQKKLQQFKIKYFVVKYCYGKHSFFQNIPHFNNLIFKLNRNKLLVILHYYIINVMRYFYTHKYKLNKIAYRAKIKNLNTDVEKILFHYPMVTVLENTSNFQDYKQIMNFNKNLLDKFKILNYLKFHIHSNASLSVNCIEHSEKFNLNNSENFSHLSLPENLIHLAMVQKNHKIYELNNENKLESNSSFKSNKFFSISEFQTLQKNNKRKIAYNSNKTFYKNNVLYMENEKYTSMSVLNNYKLKNTNSMYFNSSRKVKYYNSIYKTKLSKEIIPASTSETPVNEQNALTFKHLLVKKVKNSADYNFFYGTLQNPPYKNHLESVIYKNLNCNVNLLFFKTDTMFMSASFLINEIIYYIEKKIPFFKIKNYILTQLTLGLLKKKLRVKGLRVICSGRVGGKSKKAQRSKNLNFKYGETSLNIFSGKMDFKSKNAFTSFGTIGLKVWISYY